MSFFIEGPSILSFLASLRESILINRSEFASLHLKLSPLLINAIIQFPLLIHFSEARNFAQETTRLPGVTSKSSKKYNTYLS